MGAPSFFVGLGWVALVFGVILLALPAIQVVRGVQTWSKVAGLLVSGVGFILLGSGFAFVHLGGADAILPGIVLTGVGQFWQRRITRDGRST